MPSDAEIEAAMAADAEREAGVLEMHASAAHVDDQGEGDSPWSFNGLEGETRDIAPPQIEEVSSPPHPASPLRGGEV